MTSDWRKRHETAKERVGMADYGTVEYYRNAAQVLATHAGPDMRPETRGKLQDLARSSDPDTRSIAQRALDESQPGHPADEHYEKDHEY